MVIQNIQAKYMNVNTQSISYDLCIKKKSFFFLEKIIHSSYFVDDSKNSKIELEKIFFIFRTIYLPIKNLYAKDGCTIDISFTFDNAKTDATKVELVLFHLRCIQDVNAWKRSFKKQKKHSFYIYIEDN